MITIEEMEEILDEIASGIPSEIFRELNGGINILPETKLNPASTGNDLYIMGEYCRGGNLGRYINIYYGSFLHIYGYLDRESIKGHLEHTLKHELTHHLESLAGEKDLEIKDAEFISGYLKQKRKNS